MKDAWVQGLRLIEVPEKHILNISDRLKQLPKGEDELRAFHFDLAHTLQKYLGGKSRSDKKLLALRQNAVFGGKKPTKPKKAEMQFWQVSRSNAIEPRPVSAMDALNYLRSPDDEMLITRARTADEAQIAKGWSVLVLEKWMADRYLL